MTEKAILKSDIEYAEKLIASAHNLINRPAQAGRVWAKYPREQATEALSLLLEARLMLRRAHPTQREREDTQ